MLAAASCLGEVAAKTDLSRQSCNEDGSPILLGQRRVRLPTSYLPFLSSLSEFRLPNPCTLSPHCSVLIFLPTFPISHLLTFFFFHLLTFSPSHPLTLSPSHPLTFSPSYLLTFSPSHLLTLLSSHLLNFPTSQLPIFSTSHLLLLSPSSFSPINPINQITYST
jgi:hypothetical protein